MPFEHRRIGQVTYCEVRALLARIRDEDGRQSVALRLHAHLKSFFKWCVIEQMIPHSPISEMPPPAPEPARREREWFTKEAANDFIRKLWDYATVIGGDDGKVLKLLLITGKRRGIVQGMRWRDIDDNWLWTPPAGSKSKRNNPIVLPKLARRIIGARPDDATTVLSKVLSDMAMWTLAKHMQKAVEPTYFHHGLRHVVATGLAQLKVPPHIARMSLDHAAVNDVHAGYEHVDWTDEIAAAMEKWAQHIEGLVAPAEGVAVFN